MPEAIDWRAYLRGQLPQITGDSARDLDIVEELAQHLDQLFTEKRAAGASADEAFVEATRELRDHQLVRDIRRASAPNAAPTPPPMGGSHIVRDFLQDARYAVRLLIRNPGFTAAAILTLTLGIGMTAAIFTVIDGVLLRPMPYPEPSRLVMVWETDRSSGTFREPGSFPDFLDYRQRSRVTDRLGAFTAFDANLQPDDGDPLRVAALAASPDVFEMLGVRPVMGRSFTQEDDRSGAPQTVLISERLRAAVFAGGDVVGRTIRINDRPRTIVGVVRSDADVGIAQLLRAANYGGGFATRDPRLHVDVWAPLQGDVRRWPRSTHPILLMGRLRQGIERSAAQQQLAAVATDLEREYPMDNEARGVSLESLQDVIFGPVGPPLALLMAAVGVVLLIACVNVANLLLTRGTRRLREVAVRSALGAESSRLARQFVAENVVMTMTAGALAVVVAAALVRALLAMAPGDIPRLADIAVNGRVMLLAFAVAAAIGLAFSLVPVVQTRQTALRAILRSEDRHSSGGRDGQVFRAVLVVAEVAFAVLLVTGAGLLIKSFWQLRSTSPGFEMSGVLKAEFELPGSRYPVQQTPFQSLPTSPAIQRFNDALVQRVGALPGVAAVAFAANHPLDGGFASSFLVVGREAESRNWPEISIRRVTPKYFETLHIPIVRGRGLDDRDADPRSPGVVVNQTVVDQFFQGREPIGQAIGFWGQPWRIVGVAGNERSQGVTREAPIAVYLPLAMVPSSAEALIVRTSGDPAALTSVVRATIRELDPRLVVFGLEPLQETLSKSLSEQRFLMLLLGLFAALAIALAAIGVHGVLSCTVAQRTREIGIRMALGASAGEVIRFVVVRGALFAAVGLVVGLGLALAFGRLISGLLYGVKPTDIVTLAGVTVTCAVVAALSLWLPVRRAVSIDPLVALRQE
jgi:putative ABC transport system permease protein